MLMPQMMANTITAVPPTTGAGIAFASRASGATSASTTSIAPQAAVT